MAMEFKMETTEDKGRRFNDPADGLMSAVDEELDSIFKDAERAARRQICPVHHQRPSVKRRRAGANYELHIEACCEDAVARAEAAASSAQR
ncbi:MAG TPA: hypothetical protein VGP17_14650 [Solirubrobacteraceae bacterium]|jgi:hypothetical protein|nr:hypothetical protein [Solirubrobacteraceae bacterium]